MSQNTAQNNAPFNAEKRRSCGHYLEAIHLLAMNITTVRRAAWLNNKYHINTATKESFAYVLCSNSARLRSGVGSQLPKTDTSGCTLGEWYDLGRGHLGRGQPLKAWLRREAKRCSA